MARTHGSRNRVGPAGARTQAWQAMRVMRRFTSADILTTAEIGYSNLRDYLRALRGAGFVAIVQPRVSGRPGSRDLYQLLRDSGPQAPFHSRDDSMLDANTGIVYDRHGHVIEQPEPPAPKRMGRPPKKRGAGRKGGAA